MAFPGRHKEKAVRADGEQLQKQTRSLPKAGQVSQLAHRGHGERGLGDSGSYTTMAHARHVFTSYMVALGNLGRGRCH